MKRLNITNFTNRVMEIHSDFFEVGYCSNGGDRYLIGLDIKDVVSFNPLSSKHYKMSIDKVTNEDGNYGIWLWEMESNVSYPMSIRLDDISSLSRFTSFLNHTLRLADEGSFSGSNGCMIK